MRGSALVRLGGASLLVALSVAAPAGADIGIQADLSCARRSDPGRVGCEISVQSDSKAHTLRWVDGLVVEAPHFLAPLRARVTAELPSEGRASATVPLAFLASELGRGLIRIEVRAVLCPEAGESAQRCVPATLNISKQITVG